MSPAESWGLVLTVVPAGAWLIYQAVRAADRLLDRWLLPDPFDLTPHGHQTWDGPALRRGPVENRHH